MFFFFSVPENHSGQQHESALQAKPGSSQNRATKGNEFKVPEVPRLTVNEMCNINFQSAQKSVAKDPSCALSTRTCPSAVFSTAREVMNAPFHTMQLRCLNCKDCRRVSKIVKLAKLMEMPLRRVGHRNNSEDVYNFSTDSDDNDGETRFKDFRQTRRQNRGRPVAARRRRDSPTHETESEYIDFWPTSDCVILIKTRNDNHGFYKSRIILRSAAANLKEFDIKKHEKLLDELLESLVGTDDGNNAPEEELLTLFREKFPVSEVAPSSHNGSDDIPTVEVNGAITQKDLQANNKNSEKEKSNQTVQPEQVSNNIDCQAGKTVPRKPTASRRKTKERLSSTRDRYSDKPETLPPPLPLMMNVLDTSDDANPDDAKLVNAPVFYPNDEEFTVSLLCT